MVKIVTIIVFIHTFFTIAEAQTKQRFKIELAGISIGYAESSLHKTNEITEIRLKSEVSFWMFGRNNIALETTETYKNGVLQQATAISNYNGRHYISTTVLADNVYSINAQSNDYSYSASHLEPIVITTTALYFNAPQVGQEIFAPHYGVFAITQQTKENQFTLKVVDGEQRYQYANNQLVVVDLINKIKNVRIIRQSNSPK